MKNTKILRGGYSLPNAVKQAAKTNFITVK